MYAQFTSVESLRGAQIVETRLGFESPLEAEMAMRVVDDFPRIAMQANNVPVIRNLDGTSYLLPESDIEDLTTAIGKGVLLAGQRDDTAQPRYLLSPRLSQDFANILRELAAFAKEDDPSTKAMSSSASALVLGTTLGDLVTGLVTVGQEASQQLLATLRQPDLTPKAIVCHPAVLFAEAIRHNTVPNSVRLTLANSRIKS